jgi:hypothetical protein
LLTRGNYSLGVFRLAPIATLKTARRVIFIELRSLAFFLTLTRECLGSVLGRFRFRVDGEVELQIQLAGIGIRLMDIVSRPLAKRQIAALG